MKDFPEQLEPAEVNYDQRTYDIIEEQIKEELRKGDQHDVEGLLYDFIIRDFDYDSYKNLYEVTSRYFLDDIDRDDVLDLAQEHDILTSGKQLICAELVYDDCYDEAPFLYHYLGAYWGPFEMPKSWHKEQLKNLIQELEEEGE